MESRPKRRKITGDAGLPSAAGSLTSASPFVLLTGELLKDVKLDYGQSLKDVDSVLFRLKGAIEKIEPHSPIPITEATKKFEKKNRIKIPYPDPKPSDDSPYNVSFAKPARCNVVGSYVSRTMVKTQANPSVDMVVEMPREIFQEKDHLNMRYFYRRSYYLAHLAVGIRKELGAAATLSFEYLHDNLLLPILVIHVLEEQQGSPDSGAKIATETQTSNSNQLAAKTKPRCLIKIIPCCSVGVLTRTKLRPSCGNNRQGGSSDEAKAPVPTPFYNSTLKAEETFVPYLQVLTLAKKECPAFTDACVLGRVWLEQRGMTSSVSGGGFGHFEWSVVIALLLQSGHKGQAALSSSLSSTEIFKATVQWLSATEFIKKPYIFGAFEPGTEAVRESGPVLFDPARELNIAYKMTPWSAYSLRLHAKSTMESLSDPALAQFEPTFIVKSDMPLQTFDSMAELTIEPQQKGRLPRDASRGLAWNSALDVYNIMSKALSDRAGLVHVRWCAPSSWQLADGPGAPKSAKLSLGVVFDAAHMGRQMELGPPAEEQKDAAKFRALWGERAELRRFKDGSILECVEWPADSAFGIYEEITRYILGRHLKLPSQSIVFKHTALPTILPLSRQDKDMFDAVRKMFTVLESDIRGLSDMPLHVRRLVAVAPELRYASTKVMGQSQNSLAPMDVLLYFEASSKWPENLTAIQEAKIEFLLDIDRRLTAVNDNVTTYLGRENVELGMTNLAYLDIAYNTGVTFRLRIHCELEESLLERQAKNTTLSASTRAESEVALASLQWRFTNLPLHAQTIATYCTRLPALSPTIRLMKHWFHSQKLANHFSEELIELMVLHVFLQPQPWRTPTSVSTGFMQVLSFLARWDWREVPLIVDFDGASVSRGDRSAMLSVLESWRKRDAHMKSLVLFAATPFDHSGLAYTRTGPSRMAAMRMTQLAKAGRKLAKEAGFDSDGRQLFQTPLHDYDFLLHLSRKAVHETLRAAGEEARTRHSRFKNLEDRTGRSALPISRHPTQVLTEALSEAYEDSLVFFRGDDEDLVIGGLWNPKIQKQNFRSGLPYNMVRVEPGAEPDAEEGEKVDLNRRAVLLEIGRIGGDLIRKIEEV